MIGIFTMEMTVMSEKDSQTISRREGDAGYMYHSGRDAKFTVEATVFRNIGDVAIAMRNVKEAMESAGFMMK